MFIAVIAGSDKTTVSAGTGHQVFHPVYQSPACITNTARRAHGNGMLPVAFLPIPKGKTHFILFINTISYSVLLCSKSE